MASCPRWIKGKGGWHGHRCGKPAEEDIGGTMFCPQCAKSERRSRTMREDKKAAREVQRQKEEAWRDRMQRAAEVLGVNAQLDSMGMDYKDSVVISLDDFEQLAKRLKPLPCDTRDSVVTEIAR